MSNPFDPAYLVEASSGLGWLAILFLVLQVALVGTGLSFMLRIQEIASLQRTLLRRLGILMVSCGGVGMLLFLLRVADIAPFTQRYWLYLLLLVEVACAAYVFYYARMIYPAQKAQQVAQGKRSRTTSRTSTAIPQQHQNGTQAGSTTTSTGESLEPMRTRRTARRERKRKQR